MTADVSTTPHSPNGLDRPPPRSIKRRVVIDLAGSTLAAFGFFWLILESLDRFRKIDFLATLGLMGWYLMVLHAIIVGGGIAWVRFARRAAYQKESEPQQSTPDERLSTALVHTIQALHKEGEHAEIVRLGAVLSRPFWISGRYRERVAIGGIYEDAAGRIGDRVHQAEALIDDLGWTNAVLGHISHATKNIEHGISLAKSINDPYLEAKGLRHLGMVQQKFLQRPDEAQEYFKRAKEAAERIRDDRARGEMIAGILFNRGEGFLLLFQFDKAREAAERALRIYRELEDTTREIKVMTLIAETHLAANELAEARDQFRKSLAAAQKHVRRDEIGKSLLGLGETYLREGNFEMASKILSDAVDTLNQIGLRKEALRAEDLLRRAENKDSL